MDALTAYQNKEQKPEATTPTFMDSRTISNDSAMDIHRNLNPMHSGLILRLRQCPMHPSQQLNVTFALTSILQVGCRSY